VAGNEMKSAMTRDRISELRLLEGQQVCLALAHGTRIDDCQLVSAGRVGVDTVWIFSNGRDVFVPLETVVDVW
jgi:hypothetical protein